MPCYNRPMRNDPRDPAASATTSNPEATQAYEPPRFEVIGLDCEITAYAPDGDDPLF